MKAITGAAMRRAEAVAFLRFYFCDDERGVAPGTAECGLETIIALLEGRQLPDPELARGFRNWRELGGDEAWSAGGCLSA